MKKRDHISPTYLIVIGVQVANLLGIDEFLDDMLKGDVEHPKLEKVPKLLDDALAEYPH